MAVGKHLVFDVKRLGDGEYAWHMEHATFVDVGVGNRTALDDAIDRLGEAVEENRG